MSRAQALSALSHPAPVSVAYENYVSQTLPAICLTHITRAVSESVPSLDKSFFVSDQAPDLDDVAGCVILQNLDCLWGRNTTSQQPDEIPSIENGSGIKC